MGGDWRCWLTTKKPGLGTRRSRRPHLGLAERDNIHVTIAVGETFAAIHHLITSAAGRQNPPNPRASPTVQQLARRLRGHEDERRLRGLLECLRAPMINVTP